MYLSCHASLSSTPSTNARSKWNSRILWPRRFQANRNSVQSLRKSYFLLRNVIVEWHHVLNIVTFFKDLCFYFYCRTIRSLLFRFNHTWNVIKIAVNRRISKKMMITRSSSWLWSKKWWFMFSSSWLWSIFRNKRKWRKGSVSAFGSYLG